MGRKWKYPQIILLLIGCAIAAYAPINFASTNDYVEAYHGPFGQWTLRLVAPECKRPGESLQVITWVSSPVGRPNYQRLLLDATDGTTSTDEVELKGSMLSYRGSLTLPPTASANWSLRLKARLWNGSTEEIAIPLASLLDETSTK